MESLDELRKIAQIMPGQTYSPTYKSILNHRAWSTSFWRTYNRESIATTVNHIESIVDTAIYNNVSTELLEAAIGGINNLISTYSDKMKQEIYSAYVENLRNIVTRIQCYLQYVAISHMYSMIDY